MSWNCRWQVRNMSSVTFIHRSFNRIFACSSTHSFMLALTHQASQPAIQPVVCHLISIIHFFYSHSFIFFSFTFHSFVRSFICSLIDSFYSVWSLTFSVCQMILFLIKSSAFVVQLDILKIYFCSKIDIMDEEVGINRSSHKYAPYC